ncbi:tetratricopeptide repeat protein [bacterium]|nr:tetratricopeptide repeat protein [bacterium]
MRRWLGQYLLLFWLLLLCTPALAQESAMQRADRAYDAGDYAQAAAEYELITADYPGHPLAWLQLARSQAQLGDWNSAVDSYKRLAQLGPLDSEVRVEYADALRQTGRLEDAVEQYNLALDKPPVPDAAVLDQAAQALEAGRPAEAERLYLGVLDDFPDNIQALAGLAGAFAAQEKWRPAIELYGRLVELGQDEAELHLAYGDALRASGDLEQALVQYNLAVGPEPVASEPVPEQPAARSKALVPNRGKPLPATDRFVMPELAWQTAEAPAEEPEAKPVAAPTPQPAPVTQPTPEPAPAAAVPEAPAAFRDAPTESTATELIPALPADEQVDSEYVAREIHTSEVVFPTSRPATSVVFYEGRADEDKDEPDLPTEPEDGDWLALARSYGRYGDWENAVRAYEELIRQDQVDTDIRLEYAAALRGAEDYDLSEQEYNRILHGDPDNIDAKTGLAKTLAHRGELDEAMYLLDQVGLDTESMMKARLARAYCYFINGYLLETWSDIGDVLASNPANAEAVYLLQTSGLTSESWTQIRGMLEAVPGNEEVLALIDQINLAEQQRWLQLPEDSPDRAEALYLRGKYEEALRAYQQLAVTDPLNARAFLRLGTLYTWEESWEESVTAYETYLRLNPSDPEARLRYAQALMYSGDPELAREVIESLINDVDVPIDVYDNALVTYAAILNALGLRQEALRWFEEALVSQPSNAEIRLAYADVLAAEKDFRRAEIQYNLVLKEDPTNEAARVGLGRSYTWQGDYAQAREQYGAVPMSSDYYSTSRIGLAYTHLWQGDAGQARSLANEAARMDPNNPELAVLYESLRQTPGGGVATSLTSIWTQSHDSDDNDDCTIVTTLTAPLGNNGAALTVSHNDFKLDNTKRGEETVGTKTRATVGVPLGDNVYWRFSASHLDIDNAADPGYHKWDWGTGLTVDLTSDWQMGVGISEQTFIDTTQLCRYNIDINETWLSSDWQLNNSTRLSMIYAFGDIADGNERNSFSVNLRRSRLYQNQGRLHYGIAGRWLAYNQNTANGYWDPHNYRFAEVYADWLDMSDRPILFDFGVGFGVDKETAVDYNTVFRWNAGVRKKLLKDRLELRAGYSASDAATNATSGAGYEHESWYFGGEYTF